MDQINKANGWQIQNTQENGQIIEKVVSEFNFMEMATNTKEVGKTMQETVKELIGFVRERISNNLIKQFKKNF